jgi:hypothetical protein
MRGAAGTTRILTIRATLRAFANLPYTMLFILRDAIRANIIEVLAYIAIFLIVLWLFFYFRSPLN